MSKFDTIFVYLTLLLVTIGCFWILAEADNTINEAVENYIQKPQYECILKEKEIIKR